MYSKKTRDSESVSPEPEIEIIMIASVLLSASAFQQGLPSRVGSVTMCGACPFARARRLRSAIACRPRVFFPLAGAPQERLA